jgi:hypothetical protein
MIRLVEAAMLIEHRYTLANAVSADMRKFSGNKAFEIAFATGRGPVPPI